MCGNNIATSVYSHMALRFLSCDMKIVTPCFNRPSLIAILHGNENSCSLIKGHARGPAAGGRETENQFGDHT